MLVYRIAELAQAVCGVMVDAEGMRAGHSQAICKTAVDVACISQPQCHC